MSWRLRIGPFTFGRTGTRLSIWQGGTGFSIPLSKKGSSFGKIKLGPFSYFFSNYNRKRQVKDNKEYISQDKKNVCISKDENQEGISFETAAIDSLKSDREFIEKIRKNGLPWRGIQERLKDEIPEDISNRDNVAYGLVPKAMNTIFGMQDYGWKTEKRPSKSTNGETTWIVIK
ncbi:MAG TPA: hypothetical protein P5295_09880 [Spirochaetota bacterium]|nr:hypothetical protein [Spirochaetota bacterium]